jgi:glutathionyl-hydroquinone reductase
MGMLVNGEWRDVTFNTSSTGGRFERPASAFRNWVTVDGSPGPTGTGGFVAERGRYHLYVLVRFDAVYHGHFKCNIRRIVDYPALWRFTRDVYNLKGVAETVNMHHIRHHYYESHTTINPSGIVPAGPALDFSISADQLSKVAA